MNYQDLDCGCDSPHGPLTWEMITESKDIDNTHSYTIARMMNFNQCIELHYYNGKATVEYGEKKEYNYWENEVDPCEWFRLDMKDKEIFDKLYKQFVEFGNKEFYWEYAPPSIVLAKLLGDGWNWVNYYDGSGYLESPIEEEFMEYDLQTHEYRLTRDSDQDFFPLNYYAPDGYDPKDFKPFEYMEKEMLEYLKNKESYSDIELQKEGIDYD